MGIVADTSDLSNKLNIAIRAVAEAQDEFEGYLKVSSQEALSLIEDLEGQIHDLKDQIADKDGEIEGLEADIQRFVKELNIANSIQQDV